MFKLEAYVRPVVGIVEAVVRSEVNSGKLGRLPSRACLNNQISPKILIVLIPLPESHPRPLFSSSPWHASNARHDSAD